jgi:hypothetical protein
MNVCLHTAMLYCHAGGLSCRQSSELCLLQTLPASQHIHAVHRWDLGQRSYLCWGRAMEEGLGGLPSSMRHWLWEPPFVGTDSCWPCWQHCIGQPVLLAILHITYREDYNHPCMSLFTALL